MELPKSKMEFSVNLVSDESAQAMMTSLHNKEGIHSIEVDTENQRVVVESTLPTSVVQEAIESTGMLAVYRGQGTQHLGAAVSILKREKQTFGLVRFVQTAADRCIVDGSFSRLAVGRRHTIQVHQFGDLSNGCENIGDVFGSSNHTNEKIVGNIGDVIADEHGNANLRYEHSKLTVGDIIGRSVCIHSIHLTSDNNETDKRVACGIIARAAGLFENTKKLCTCSGKTLWEERIETKQQTS